MDKYDKALQNLFDKSARPNKVFVKGLKESILSEFKKDNPPIKFISIFNMKISQKIIKYSAFSLAGLVALGLLGGGSYYAYKTYIQPERIAEQQRILNLIAQNSPQSSYETEKTVDTAEGASVTNSKMASLMIPYSVERDYNYIKIVNEYEIGKGIDKGRDSVPYYGSVTKDESIQYFANKTDYMSTDSLYAVYYGDDIYDYSLIRSNESWTYRGGSYAVHTINNEQIQTAVSYLSKDSVLESEGSNVEVEGEDLYKLRFGEDAKVLDTITKDGKKYYKIQWSYESGGQEYVSGTTVTDDSSDSRKIYTVALVDTESYEIISQDVYIDSISEGNKLYSLTTTTVERNVNQEDIDSEFSFNFDVPVKTYDLSEYDQSKEYKEDLISYLKDNKLDVLYLNNTDYELNSINSPYVISVSEYESYLIDRDFYSSKQYGEDLYNDYKDMFKPYLDTTIINSRVQLYYSNSDSDIYSSVSVDEYDKIYTDTELIRSLMGEVDSDSMGSISVKIGNEVVSAKVFRIGFETNADSSESCSVDSTDEVTNTGCITYGTYLITFEYENRSYLVQMYSDSEINLSSFESLLDFSKAVYSDTSLLNTVLEPKVVEEIIAY